MKSIVYFWWVSRFVMQRCSMIWRRSSINAHDWPRRFDRNIISIYVCYRLNLFLKRTLHTSLLRARYGASSWVICTKTWTEHLKYIIVRSFVIDNIQFKTPTATYLCAHKVMMTWADHICVFNLTTIGSDNVLSPGRHQAIIRTNAGILLIGPLGTNFCEISIGIQAFSFKKMHAKMSSVKWRSFCLGLNVLINQLWYLKFLFVLCTSIFAFTCRMSVSS